MAAIASNMAGYQQTVDAAVGAWETIFDASVDANRASSGEQKPIYGVYIEAQVFDLYVRISPLHKDSDATFFVLATDAGGIRIPAGQGEYFYSSGKPSSGAIDKIEVSKVAIGAKVTWRPVVT